MKADQSSIFRHLEVLHLWCAETFDNAPKNEVVREDVRILVQNIVQAQSAVTMALQVQMARQRLELLDVVVLSMTNIKSVTKVLTAFSTNKERGKHVIDKSARIRLLDIMTQIGIELGRWRNKTLARAAQEEAAKISN